MTCNDCKYYTPFTQKAGFCDLIDLDFRKLESGRIGALADAVKPSLRNAKDIACLKFKGKGTEK